MSKISKELIERYIRQELDRRELAQKACCGKMTVERELERLGIRLWDKKHTDKCIIAEYIDLYKQRKLTREQISKVYGIGMKRVYAVLKRNRVWMWDVRSAPGGSDKPAPLRSRRVGSDRYFDWREYKGSLFYMYNRG